MTDPGGPALRTVAATRYVTPLREGGSLPGLIEADDDGLYVLKFRGAGQGVRALTAEVIAGEVGRTLGLAVPELVLVELDPALGKAEPDSEIRELIVRSPGLNLGLDFLPGALPFDPASGPVTDPDLAASIVWLDALLTNPDRSARNPNLLRWHGRLFCIDHGAALYIHHTWRDPEAHAVGRFPPIRDHVLLPFASSIPEAEARLAPLLDAPTLAAIVALVPDDWLVEGPVADGSSPGATRAAYLHYLVTRLGGPRAWVEEAEQARLEAIERAVA